MFIFLLHCRAIIVRLSSIIVLIITLFILIRCSQAVNDTTDEQTCRFNLNTILGTTANGINSTTECTEVRALVTLPTYYTNQPTLSPPLLTPSFSLHSLILSFLPHSLFTPSFSPFSLMQCWETFIGQEFYKLGLTNFAVTLLSTIGVETLRQ